MHADEVDTDASLVGRPAALNLLLDEGGRLSAVIDFGCLGVGDPACDLMVAWTFFSGESREVFRAALFPFSEDFLPLLVRGEVGAIPIATGEVQRQHTRTASSCTQSLVVCVA
jgi:hypothetical protein